MRTIDLLSQLQNLDNRIEGAQNVIVQLQSQIGERSELDRLIAAVAATQSALHALEGQQLDLELQVEQARTKIKTTEAKLYGGKVTSPKELSSLGEEVEQEKRQLATVEDRLLDVLQRVEDARSDLDAESAALASRTAGWRTEQAALAERLATTEAGLTQARGQRAPLLASIPTPMQVTYETLRRQKGGVAVAEVKQRTCQTCRVGLTPSQEQRARQGMDLVLCNSCGRILHATIG